MPKTSLLPLPRQTFLKACKKDDVHTVVDLLNTGIMDIESRDECGQTALMIATNSGSIDVINLLIENGADVNAKDKRGVRVLSKIYPAFNGNGRYCEAVKILLDSNADIDAHDNDNGMTALMHYCLFGVTNCARILLDRGADMYIKCREGRMAKDYAKIAGLHMLKVMEEVRTLYFYLFYNSIWHIYLQTIPV